MISNGHDRLKRFHVPPLCFFLFAMGTMAAQEQKLPLLPQSPEKTLHSVLGRLTKSKVNPKDFAKVPPAVRGDITLAKSAMRLLLEEAVNAAHTEFTDRTLASYLRGYLKVKGFAIAQSEEEEAKCGIAYGCIFQVSAQHPEGWPELLVLTTSLQVPYGDDGSLYVLQRAQGVWRTVLVCESNGYPEISGALGSMQYAFSPRAGAGAWYVAVTSINPWQTSVWQELSLRILTPGKSPLEPEIDFENYKAVNITEKQTVRAALAGVTVRYSTESFLDPEKTSRVSIIQLQHSTTGWQRTPPYAEDASGLVEEWLQLKWPEAAPLTEPSQLAAQKEWHRRMNVHPEDYDLSLADAYECGMGSGLWHVEVDVEPDEGKHVPLPSTVYFKVLMGKEKQQLLEISARPFAECPPVKIAGMREGISVQRVAPELFISSSAR